MGEDWSFRPSDCNWYGVGNLEWMWGWRCIFLISKLTPRISCLTSDLSVWWVYLLAFSRDYENFSWGCTVQITASPLRWIWLCIESLDDPFPWGILSQPCDNRAFFYYKNEQSMKVHPTRRVRGAWVIGWRFKTNRREYSSLRLQNVRKIWSKCWASGLRHSWRGENF